MAIILFHNKESPKLIFYNKDYGSFEFFWFVSTLVFPFCHEEILLKDFSEFNIKFLEKSSSIEFSSTLSGLQPFWAPFKGSWSSSERVEMGLYRLNLKGSIKKSLKAFNVIEVLAEISCETKAILKVQKSKGKVSSSVMEKVWVRFVLLEKYC